MSGTPTLTYCTNVHPSETLEQMQDSLRRWTVPLARRLRDVGFARPFPVGLYLSAATVRRLGDDATRAAFREFLREHELEVVTLNCFPYGDFHARGLKQRVFEPGWQDRERLEYSLAAARLLVDLVEAPATVSISTLAGAWKPTSDGDAVRAAMAAHLAEAAEVLHQLRERSGVEVVLSLEPEPLSTLETTQEAVSFFDRLLDGPAAERRRRHVGVCYDTCHQAVEFEDTGEALRRLVDGGVRLGKVQLSSAPVIERPAANPAALAFLARFDEPRFLHQTVTRDDGGALHRYADLPEFLALDPATLGRVAEARTHFHVPIDREQFAPLGTTRRQMVEAVRHTLTLPEPPLLEVETYTFGDLPGSEETALLDGLERELRSARALIDAHRPPQDEPAPSS